MAALLLAFSVTAAADRPNILFIIADDASRDSFGAYGSTYVKTPGFDRVSAEGVLFTQAYNCNPKCAPARACLLTGRYSWQLEEACNHQPFLSDKWQFYPYLLEKAGYRIGYTGKGWGPGVWQGNDASRSRLKDNPAGPPWNGLRAKPPYKGISDIDYAGNFEAFLHGDRDRGLEKPRRKPPKNGGSPGPRQEPLAPEPLDPVPPAELEKPFCFWLGAKEPHRRYELDSHKKAGRDLADVTVPAYYPDNATVRGDLADYALEVEWFDTHIVRALDHLDAAGRLDNTLIIVTSDHGMPFPRVKGQVYDDGFHVPFAARWADKITPGRTVTDFITFPDLAPTLMEAAGVEPTGWPAEQMTGQSFLPQLLAKESGRIDAGRDHTLLGKERHDLGRTDGDLLSVGYPVRAIRTDRFLYVRNFKPDRWPVGDPEYGLLNCDGSPTKSFLTDLSPGSDDHSYYEMSFGRRPAEELYDIAADPDCVRNLAESEVHRHVMAALWSQLESELKMHGDPRVLGGGDIFDDYPNRSVERQQKLYGRPDYDPVRSFEEKYGTLPPGTSSQ